MIQIIKDENDFYDEANIPKSESDSSFFDRRAIERENTPVFIIGQIELVKITIAEKASIDVTFIERPTIEMITV